VANETERVRGIYEEVADKYDRLIGLPERLLFKGGRQWVCSRTRGDVLEIALGTGRNLPHYPGEIRLTGIELSPAMVEVAHRRARELDIEVDLREGDAQSLPFPDDAFDTVVSTLSLCTIPDDRRAVSEAARVLRPGGRLLLLEHVRSPNPAVRVLQRLLEPLSVRFQADHLLREPLYHLQEAGLELENLERWKQGLVERVVACKPV
jgi:ubiquinone/menaquinone biosynthesis C-methylase UbiE